MMSYLISYDLNSPGQNYNDLYEAINNLGSCWHCLDSTWILDINKPAVDIRNALTPYIDSNDKLLVVKLSGEGAWTGFDRDCSSWLKNNL